MENNNKQTISTPVAIVIAGVLIMIGVLATKTGNINTNKTKTLSEQVGVNKDKLVSCIKDTNWDEFSKKMEDSVIKAMKAIPENERGTPYSVIIAKNGTKVDIRGYLSYEDYDVNGKKQEGLKNLLNDIESGKTKSNYTGEIPPVTEEDHLLGDKNADIIVVEYSDFECPYCKKFQDSMKKAVTLSNGKVAWVYRNWPLHQNSFEKLANAECVAKLKGNEAFWKYSDLLFGMSKTANDPISDQL